VSVTWAHKITLTQTVAAQSVLPRICPTLSAKLIDGIRSTQSNVSETSPRMSNRPPGADK
jgi:hypothetical protein